MYDYICKFCSNPFQNRKKDKVFCSMDCVTKSKTENRKAICGWCKGEFLKNSINEQRNYCSKACSNSATKRNRVMVACAWCSKSFEKVPTQVTHKEGNFCSVECFHLHSRGGQKQELTKNCKNCKKKFTVLFIDRKQEFCSRSCAKTGEFHPYYGKEGPTKGIKPWSYGLTKKTDIRIASLALKVSETHKRQFVDGIRTNRGMNNPNWGKTVADRTPEQLENYSKGAIQRVLDGFVGNWRNFKTGYFSSKKNAKELFYRSSYEYRIMNCLENMENVIAYQHEPFSIKYGTGKRYVPDFLVFYHDGSRELIETKCARKDWTESTELKMKAGEEYCASFEAMKYKLMYLVDIEQLEQRLGIEHNPEELKNDPNKNRS